MGSYIFDQLNEIRKQSNFNIKLVKIVSILSNEKDYLFKNFQVKIFKVIDFPFFIFPGFFNFINKMRFRLFLKNNNIENIKFSHSHVSYPSSYLVEDLECYKIIQHHGLDVLQLTNGRNKFIKNIQKRFLIINTIKKLNNADINIGVSDLVLKQLRNYKTYNPKKEFVLYNGVDRSKFFKKESYKDDIYTIGCVANFWEIKDQISLIKAIEFIIEDGITDIELRLIGTGKKLDFCKQYVKNNNLVKYIYFEKERKHSELNIFYNQLDLFVLPSYYEALGCVYLEAWATNIPVISIEGQGFSELVGEDEKNNLLAKKISPESLKEKILGEYSRKRQYPFDEKYDIRRTISDFLKLNIFRYND